MAMVGKTLGENQDIFSKQVRLLRTENGQVATRPLHPVKRSELSGDSSVEHCSGLPELLAEKGEDASVELVQGQTAACPHCGTVGLVKSARCFVNPPYGNQTNHWLARCAEHKNVTALIFARTETRQFFDYIWGKATAVCFLKGRLSFYHVNGTKGGTAGAPSMLVTWDDENANALWDAVQHGRLAGCFVDLRGGNTAP